MQKKLSLSSLIDLTKNLKGISTKFNLLKKRETLESNIQPCSKVECSKIFLPCEMENIKLTDQVVSYCITGFCAKKYL